nr:MAG TPA: hypothetical protein [Caudoviricetes sp.]
MSFIECRFALLRQKKACYGAGQEVGSCQTKPTASFQVSRATVLPGGQSMLRFVFRIYSMRYRSGKHSKNIKLQSSFNAL